MDAVKKQVIDLIRDYTRQMGVALEMLNHRLKEDKFFHIINRSGYLDVEKKVKYEFHGYGCSVSFLEGEIIDFNFTDYGYPTFEPWFLHAYLMSKKEHYTLISGFNITKIRTSLKELKEDNMVQELEDPLINELYCLTTDVENPAFIKFGIDETMDDEELTEQILERLRQEQSKRT